MEHVPMCAQARLRALAYSVAIAAFPLVANAQSARCLETFQRYRQYTYEHELAHYRDVARLDRVNGADRTVKCSDESRELARRLDSYTKITAGLAAQFARSCLNDPVLRDVAKSEGVRKSNATSHVEATFNQLCSWQP
jgi:hypothetical protein